MKGHPMTTVRVIFPLCHARHLLSGIHPQNFLPEVAI